MVQLSVLSQARSRRSKGGSNLRESQGGFIQ